VNDGAWSDHIGGDGMEALIDYSDANVMYGTLYYGDIYRTLNGGVSWGLVTGSVTESGGWITPYVIDPEDPMTLYGGYRHVWKTTNRGSSWSMISNFGGGTLSLLEVAPSNSDVIYAGTGSLLYRTTDGGATDWSVITRPVGSGTITDLTVHQSDPDHIWVTSSGFTAGQKVYESTDGGTTWVNVSSNLPNIPVNCITFQNNSPDRVYVGTDLGVWYRDLAAPEWAEFNDGLANVVVTELEMQYSDNKLRAATYGRGIWESDAVENSGAVIGSSGASIDFGRIEAGTASEPAEIVFTNLGTADTLVISSISLTGPDFELVSIPTLPAPLGPDEMISITVRFAPDQHGMNTDTISVESNATNNATLRIPLAGIGVVIDVAATGTLYAANDSLFVVDLLSGALTGIGGTGGVVLTSLAVRPSSHELVGVASDASQATLYRLSASFGDAVMAQTFSVPLLRAIAFSQGDTLYGAVAFGAEAGTLWRLDPGTGDAEEIGASGVSYSSLAFDPATGVLFATERPPVGTKDRVYTVNTETGEATLVGEVGDPFRVTAAITFDDHGALFGITGSGQLENELVSINPATGAGTIIGGMGSFDISGLAIRVDSLTTGANTESTTGLPSVFTLGQNYPNPFNPTTRITYGLPQRSQATITVFNTLGQEIRRLVQGEQNAGYHHIQWDATNAGGATVASGIYFYRLDAAASDGTQFTRIRKMLLIR